MAAFPRAAGAPRLPELALQAGTLVLGDLHLDVSPRGGGHEVLATWLRALERVPCLVVLGDLFDAWVGPAQMELAPARAVCAALARLTRRGHPGRRRCTATATSCSTRPSSGPPARGCTPPAWWACSPGPGARRALFVHGDELCTLDRSYQRLSGVAALAPGRAGSRPGCRGGAPCADRPPPADEPRCAPWRPSRAAEKEQQPQAALAPRRQRGAAASSSAATLHRFRDEPLEDGLRWIVLDAFGGPRDLVRVGPDGGLEPVSSRPGGLAEAPSRNLARFAVGACAPSGCAWGLGAVTVPRARRRVPAAPETMAVAALTSILQREAHSGWGQTPRGARNGGVDPRRAARILVRLLWSR